MSIATLKKVTLAGKLVQKMDALAHLQALGTMHLLPLAAPPAEPEKAATRRAEDAYKALRFLAEVAGEKRQIRRDPGFDVDAFVGRTLDLKQKLREAGDRRDFLQKRIRDLDPWGELVFPDPALLGGQLFWFYHLPVKHRAALDDIDLPWEIISRDSRFINVVVLSPDEPDPDLLPVARIKVGSKPKSQLLMELEDAQIEIETLQDDRAALTRYLGLLRARMSEAETRAELIFATEQTLDDDRLFAVQGWMPETGIEEIAGYAEEHRLALIVEDAAPDELPPTLLEQPERDAAGVDLAMFYQVPGYYSWDPTVLLMASFSLFFAMIVADAGYGIVILIGLLLYWRSLGASARGVAWRRLGLFIALATVGYGVIVGSFFGVAPREGGMLSTLAVLQLDDFDTMMRLSIVVGVAHIVFAIAMNAWVNRRRRSAKAQLGWIAVISGGLALWLSGQTGNWATLGAALMIGGLVAIVAFSSDRKGKTGTDRAWRLLDGIMALSGAMGAFGDVLSYMRLFALGLASASLALTFNNLATQVMDAVPGLGLLLGGLILLVGHALNFALAMMSGVVHGLRLNYIEFFKWGLPEEGVAFRPLTRKEVQE